MRHSDPHSLINDGNPEDWSDLDFNDLCKVFYAMFMAFLSESLNKKRADLLSASDKGGCATDFQKRDFYQARICSLQWIANL
jgi:hypothetical protein